MCSSNPTPCFQFRTSGWEGKHGSSWDLSLLCPLIHLILVVPSRMSCLLLLSAAFPLALYLSCLCTFLILDVDYVFHGERYCNCKGQTCVGRAAYMDEWPNQLIKNEETMYVSPWIILTILWDLCLHLYCPGLSVATPLGALKYLFCILCYRDIFFFHFQSWQRLPIEHLPVKKSTSLKGFKKISYFALKIKCSFKLGRNSFFLSAFSCHPVLNCEFVLHWIFSFAEKYHHFHRQNRL